MKRCICLLVVVLAACHVADDSTPAAPVAIAEVRDTRLIEGDLHGFTPSDDLVACASRLGDPTDRARAADELKALPADRRVAVLRAGIRLRDATAARTCAGLLLWNELDDWEQGLTTRLLTDAVVDPAYVDADGDRVHFCQFFERMSGAELPYILDQIAAHRLDDEAVKYVSYVHKVASAEHLPQLSALAAASGGALREHLLDIIQCVITHTDQHREDVAGALLATSVDALRDGEAPTPGGLPPSLVAVLSIDKLPYDPHGNFTKWAWRWLADTQPTKRDVEFLLQLDAKVPGGVQGGDCIPWMLRRLDDPRIDPWLRATESTSRTRTAALVVRGGRDALAFLVAAANDDDEALNALLAVAPAEGRRLVERVVFGEDAEAAFAMLDNVRRSWEDGESLTGIGWDESAFDGFGAAAVARKLDGVRLANIGVDVPRCRMRAVAAAAVAAMPRDRVPSDENERPLELLGDVGAFFETAAPDAFRDLLRAWSRSTDGPTQTAALRALAQLGDPASGPALVEAVRRQEAEPDTFAARARAIELTTLARSPCPEVLALLREKATDDFAAAVAYGVATGLPERVGLLWFCTDEDTPVTPAVRDEVRALLLDGRWKDAVARALAAAPEYGPFRQGMESLGLVDDDRVRAHLRRLQERRELGMYPWATAELAASGDAAARAEFQRAIRVGRYRWCDENEQIAFGDPVAALPMWLGLMETNCCRFCSICCYVFDHSFDLTFQSEEARAGATTPLAEARRWLARSGGRFVPSRLDAQYGRDRFVPAPR